MECPVCFEVFKNPLLLPGCGHTVCQACCEMLVTQGNYLRCPECRLIYQLRRGIQSLPKNVALQRTIDEHEKAMNRPSLMCEQHPDDAVALYCRTCEKSICLKCYFSTTLRRGSCMHSGHSVHTAEDALSKEKRLLEDLCRQCEERRVADTELITQLEEAQTKLTELMETKLAAVEKSKTDAIVHVKQAAAKLKFILKGSVAKDEEELKSALLAARSRLSAMEDVVSEAASILTNADKHPNVVTLKQARGKLEELPIETNVTRPRVSSFLHVEKYDTDLLPCLTDPKLALSYQTDKPNAPKLVSDRLIISCNKVHITVLCDEKIRTKNCQVFYRAEECAKTENRDIWLCDETDPPRCGVAMVTLSGLVPGTKYLVYAVCGNCFGKSEKSNLLKFSTASESPLIENVEEDKDAE